ncbi:MAG: hypothetical protein ACYC1Q_00925 [Bacteroidia bacterium]
MKKIQLILRLALVPGVLFLSSCSALFYAPTSQTGHMLEKQGDLAVSATYQSTPYTNSLAGDLAYAIDKRLFVNANYQYFENTPSNRAGFMEFGIGYYNKVGRFGFFESSLLYGRARGILELKPEQIMNFSLHVPTISAIIGVKNKYLFASFGIKGGVLFKDQTTYSYGNDYYTTPWFMDDPGVNALEYMHYAAFSQFTGTIGVKYEGVSLSYFNSVLAGPKAYGTTYRFQADQFAGGLRLQVNLNVLR